MATQVQLELFNKTEEDFATKKELNNVRRGLFQRFNLLDAFKHELYTIVTNQQKEIEKLKEKIDSL